MSAPLRALASAITTCLDAAKRALASANVATQASKAADKSAQEAETVADTVRVLSTSASEAEAVALTQAGIATDQAGAATAQAGNANASAATATAAQAQTLLYRDAALIGAGSPYVDEPTGRAAVADNATFKVQGSGAVAVYEYRRLSAAASTLIATYPSKAAVDAVNLGSPTLRMWREVTVDSTGRPVRGIQLDGSVWEARSGVLVNVALAPPLVGGRATYDSLGVSGVFKATGVAYAAPTLLTWTDLLLDATGRIVSGTKFDGTEWRAVAGVLKQTSAPLPTNATPSLYYPTLGPWAEVVLDATGRVLYGTQHDGSVWQASRGAMVQVAGGAGTAAAGAQAFDYDTVTGSALLDAADPATPNGVDLLVLIIGQSWAGGYSYDVGDATVTSVPQHPGRALKLNTGIEPDGANATSYVDLCETDRPSFSKETPASGMADVIMQGLQTRFGRKPRMIFAISATGGQPYWKLKRGSADYLETLRIVSNCIAISATQGRKVVVPFIGMWHGEQDYSDGVSRALYGRALDQLAEHYAEDIPRLTGQTAPIRFYVPQMSYRLPMSVGKPSATALAQLDAPRRNTRIRCAGPQYQSPGSTADGGGHLKAVGFRMSGCLNGQAALDDYFGPYGEPLYVLAAYWVSNTVIRLQYSKQITIDATDAIVNVSGLGVGKGVDFLDGSAVPPTVTGIALAAGTTDTVEVTLSAAPTGKRPRVFVASRATDGGTGASGSGATTGNRSAIRSSSFYFNDSLSGRSLYHWACQEQIELPPIV